MLEVQGDITLEPVNGIATGSAGLLKMDSLQVEKWGRLTADGLGFTSVQGPGAGISSAGGNHGGIAGGLNEAAYSYGSAIWPLALGSGGYGGGGGGALLLQVKHGIVNHGEISANGAVYGYNSSGAGGTINIMASSLSGIGTISCNGGKAPAGRTGGSGGRIALRLDDTSGLSAQTITADGGNGTTKGAGGTIFVTQRGQRYGHGALYLSNATLVDAQIPLPGSMAPEVWTRELHETTLRVVNKGVMSLTTNIVVRDLYLDGPTPSLYRPHHPCAHPLSCRRQH